MNPEGHSPSGQGSGPVPIEPGPTIPGQLKKNRGDVVVLLGIGSLFCCPPLGVLGWIMASTDLKRIRAGEMSSEGLGTLRTGRLLGIVGTVFFVVLLAGSLLLAYRLPHSLGQMKGLLNQKLELFKKNVEEDLKPHALSRAQLVYAGEWVGDRGTFIRIATNGTGDCKYRKDHVTSQQTGGRVRIEGDKLFIGIFGVYSTWRIDKPPTSVNGTWTMILDGEVFTKKRNAPRTPPEENGAFPGSGEYEV
jgi:hypothetical protein